MSKLPPLTRARFLTGLIAVTMGCVLNHFGDRFLGVKIEFYRGLLDFNALWMVDMLVLPFFVGMLVAVIFGLGGKWLCYFPPLIEKASSYLDSMYISGVPDDALLLPYGMWALFVTVVMALAGFGGVIGELVVKRTYGRRPRELVYKQASRDKGSLPK